MSQLLKKEILRIGFYLMLGILIGAICSQPTLGAAITLFLLLAQHLWHLQRLARWLQRPNSEPPEASNLWGEVFDGLFRYRRREKNTRKQLKQALKRIKQSTQALRDGVVIIDNRGNLDWWNQAARRLLGLSTESDRGQPITNLLRNPTFIEYYEQKDYLAPLVLPSHVVNDHMLEYQITLFGQNERLLFIRDCTKVQRLQRMRQDFVANVSHELRTPLTVLSGYLETFSDYTEGLPQQWQRGLTLMLQQSARMEHLVADLLTLSRLETSEFKAEKEPIKIAQLLESIRADALALSNNQHEIIIRADNQLMLHGCASELRSAFSNLVINAVKYTPANSLIELDWHHDEDAAHLSVRDNGPGIDQKHTSYLTQRFYRVDDSRSAQTGGTGLGLAIVKHVMLRHQGRLIIQSTLGQGSCFTCQFPLSQTTTHKASTTAITAESP